MSRTTEKRKVSTREDEGDTREVYVIEAYRVTGIETDAHLPCQSFRRFG